MLFEAAAALGLLYFGAAGQTVRGAARSAGRVAGRAAGSLRRARAQVDALQARAELLGGAELGKSRADVAARLNALEAIRAETAALLSVHGGGGGARAAAAFSDEELAAALGVPAPAPAAPAPGAPTPGAPAPGAAAAASMLAGAPPPLHASAGASAGLPAGVPAGLPAGFPAGARDAPPLHASRLMADLLAAARAAEGRS